MYHKIIVVGNLGQDPVMRYTPAGVPVTNFSVATNERWKNDDGELQERTVWWRVSAWRRLAETTNEYLSKGRQVLVEGTMLPGEGGSPRIFDRNDGTPGASYEITARVVKFLGRREDADVAGGETAPAAVEEEDSIPF